MVRTKALLRPTEAEPATMWAYLSGILIGTEIAGAGVTPKSKVYLIGSEGLLNRYDTRVLVRNLVAYRAPENSSLI